MSGGQDDPFARWSRRKQAVRRLEADEADAPGEAEADRQSPEPAAEAEPAGPPPSLDDLTADGDLSAFLREGVPAALRNAATSYPYDSHEEHVVSLRGSTAAVAEHLKAEVQQRLDKAGVEVLEARISHLAYAPEIAGAMLQRQQAEAIIDARKRIVDGAVGMVHMALDLLKANSVVDLDEERKAQMVSNLLVVLCSERGTQPIVNAGTLHG